MESDRITKRYKISFLAVILSIGSFHSCEISDEKSTAERIIEKSIEVSGGESYSRAEIEFYFRNRKYMSKRSGGLYKFERIVTDSLGNWTHDILSNEGLERFENGHSVTVPDTMVTRISDGVNSVHYFVQVPYVLKSEAAKKELLGEDEVLGEPYFEIKVTFVEKGGGTDYHDEFLYWIHRENYTVDYLAYRFYTNNGGIRFRKAVNPRTIDKIRFVDYENYKIENFSFPLKDLDSLYEAGSLRLLSNIKNDSIKVKLDKMTNHLK
ncbi:MAG TPA: DUF6503 family protein [Salinimicrobium sp.]|nr:DUF6503 family protein [Salinimicrobium sp.]